MQTRLWRIAHDMGKARQTQSRAGYRTAQPCGDTWPLLSTPARRCRPDAIERRLTAPDAAPAAMPRLGPGRHLPASCCLRSCGPLCRLGFSPVDPTCPVADRRGFARPADLHLPAAGPSMRGHRLDASRRRGRPGADDVGRPFPGGDGLESGPARSAQLGGATGSDTLGAAWSARRSGVWIRLAGPPLRFPAAVGAAVPLDSQWPVAHDLVMVRRRPATPLIDAFNPLPGTMNWASAAQDQQLPRRTSRQHHRPLGTPSPQVVGHAYA